MVNVHSTLNKFIFCLSTSFMVILAAEEPFKENTDIDVPDTQIEPREKIVIKNITIQGNKYVKPETILHRFPYKIGSFFDPLQSAKAIKNIYALGSLSQVSLETESAGENAVNLYVVLTERKLLTRIDINGNKHIETKKIKEQLSSFTSMNPDSFKEKIKEYIEKKGIDSPEILNELKDIDMGEIKSMVSGTVESTLDKVKSKLTNTVTATVRSSFKFTFFSDMATALSKLFPKLKDKLKEEHLKATVVKGGGGSNCNCEQRIRHSRRQFEQTNCLVKH